MDFCSRWLLYTGYVLSHLENTGILLFGLWLLKITAENTHALAVTTPIPNLLYQRSILDGGME